MIILVEWYLWNKFFVINNADEVLFKDLFKIEISSKPFNIKLQTADVSKTAADVSKTALSKLSGIKKTE